jgi:DNA-binding FrmR family transcriptional regulator
MVYEKDRCHKIKHRTEEEKTDYVKRLNRIEGQIKGIIKMVNDDRHCDDILIQISAVNNALKSLGSNILLNHMKTCMIDDINNGNLESIDEIMELSRRLLK